MIYELSETGRFRITVGDDDCSVSSHWVASDEVASIQYKGETYIAVSPFYTGAIPYGQIFRLEKDKDTEVIRVGVD